MMHQKTARASAARSMPKQCSGFDANRGRFSASKPSMHNPQRIAGVLSGMIVAVFLALSGIQSAAQSSQPEAMRVVRAAVHAEMQADKADQSIWTYHDHDKVPGKDAMYITIETRQGSLRRMIDLDSKPLSASATQAETQRIDHYVHDSAAQAKARKNEAHDDAQAAEMLTMLPDAFLWLSLIHI